MRTDVILLRFGEIMLKGRNRARFENQIVQQIKRVLKPLAKAELHKESHGRMYVELNGESYEEAQQALSKVFGLLSISPAIKVAPELAALQEAALVEMNRYPEKPKTFKVSVRRVNKQFPHDTYEMHDLLGGHILQHVDGLKVDVKHPELELHVEIRNRDSFVYSKKVAGPGGFPLGSNGKAMLMLSGGIDSPVAGYLAMKRGLRIEAVHFHSYPYTSERAKQKVIDLTRVLADYAGSIHLHLVPFTEIQTKLKESCRDNLIITLMRRAMYRITEQLAEKRDALAIVTGESLGQVASQTLSNMNVIGRAAEIPVLRPLVTMDKLEIIPIAETIRTFPISILPYEDCCTLFVPKSPSTNPSLKVVERQEAWMEWLPEAIREAVEKTEIMLIKPEEKSEEDHLF
ncbi:tRNA uracil 4-sulfurtransferase ThiI [Paenibacillus ginsengarvi]|uniref:Probable tRNA sulfurtransferase n=1 Tax=Paenibacillus ginsengarvi TaxID=400777 RepID=A0A3B0CXB7_9BACL|nr:tRNA uracil 4-sulfurtransferase ThiI [Paenibacillus ginsengarvi]RKN86937.1 tRNA 4-thiouridine(8) synthase ThiI [Paenibacillus ginsengarvi]